MDEITSSSTKMILITFGCNVDDHGPAKFFLHCLEIVRMDVEDKAETALKETLMDRRIDCLSW